MLSINTLILSSLVLLAYPVQGRNGVRGLTSDDTLVPSCKVEGFSLYEFTDEENGFERDFITNTLDMTDYKFGQINIRAQVTEGCNPGCVRFTFAGDEGKEGVSPYYLYGDAPGGRVYGGHPDRCGGEQELKACLYRDSNCREGKQGCLTKTLNVIPTDEPLEAGPYELEFFGVVFDDVSGPATDWETAAAAEALCKVLDEYLGYGAFYRDDVGVSDFQCWGSAVGGDALTIKIDVTASVSKSTGFNPYSNRRLPEADELYSKITSLLDNNGSIGPFAPRAVDHFIDILANERSPYSTVKNFSIITNYYEAEAPSSSPSSSPSFSPTEAPTPFTSMMSPAPVSAFVCEPTSGSCASTKQELQAYLTAASPGDIVAICGGSTINTSDAPVMLSEASLTLCCAGSNCVLENDGSGRNLVVKGDKVTIVGIGFVGGATSQPDQYYGQGGNLYLNADGDHKIIDCTFRNGTASYSGGNLFATIYPGTMSIEGSSFIGGNGRYSGGGAYIEGTSESSIQECEFIENTADTAAGLVISSTLGQLSKISILNTVFNDNDGGAAAIWTGEIDLTLSGNSAEGNTAHSMNEECTDLTASGGCFSLNE